MPPSKPPPSYPPARHHKAISLAPSTAQSLLAVFVKASEEDAFLHPTSILSSTGITHGASSGPLGGLAMHHLRRIEAGLRGESLTAETDEELRAQFGQSELEGGGRATSAKLKSGETTTGVPEGDDARLDAAMAASTAEMQKGDGNKRKRGPDEIAAWAEESSKAGSPADEWEDMADFEQSRKQIIGEVGDRDTASVSQQNGAPPIVVGHDDSETESPRKRAKTAGDVAVRKAAKKARRKAEKATRHLATVTS